MNKIIPIDIYNTDLIFITGTKDDLKAALEYYLGNKNSKEVYTVMTENISNINSGKSTFLNSREIVLWIPNPKDKATLAHEIFHTVYYIMEKVGISLCHESDEAYAYLIGYITNKVTELCETKL